MNGIGRNDPCWCGSGKKFKRCHLDRETQKPPTLEEIISTTKKAYDKKYCMHHQASPKNCSGTIIRAHSVQKNGGLNMIAENGHVIGFIPRKGPIEAIKTGGSFYPELIGISKASVFTGFCGKHDAEIFRPIEGNEIEICEKHALLLAYRAICKELFIKSVVSGLYNDLKQFDKGFEKEFQFEYQQRIALPEYASKLGERDLTLSKKAMDKALISQDYSCSYYYAITLQNLPEIMCSGVMAPTHDYNGNDLQDIMNLGIIDYITCSIIGSGSNGLILFSWIGKSEPCEKFVKSMDSLDNFHLSNAIVRFVISYFENFYCSPKWWYSRSLTVRDTIVEKFQIASPTGGGNPLCMQPDGMSYVDWKIIKKEKNF
jgi:hypothetical protein